MTIFEPGWEEPTTVRRDLEWPAFLDLAVAECANARGVPPVVMIRQLVEEGLRGEAEVPENGNGRSNERPANVVRTMLWPAALEHELEESARRLQTDETQLIVGLVETALMRQHVDLEAAARRATEILHSSREVAIP